MLLEQRPQDTCDSPCDANPCHNGGQCALAGISTATPNGYTCRCTEGWTGFNCDQRKCWNVVLVLAFDYLSY